MSTTTSVNQPFVVTPGGPPEVLLERGGEVGYPGVVLRNVANAPVLPLDVTVSLPPAGGLQWGKPELTVARASGDQQAYSGTASADGQTLTFQKVDPSIPSYGARSVMWVAVSASADAPLDYTSLVFNVGMNSSSPSTPVTVVPESD
jgi:hypothetical protein